VQGRLQLDELAAGNEWVERRRLQRDADPAADLRGLRLDVEARDGCTAACRAQERDEHAYRRRLAGAVAAEDAVDLPARNLEIDPVDGLQAALELPLQVDDLDRNNARMLLHAQLVAPPHATTTPCSC
jgi:hypothetical protein